MTTGDTRARSHAGGAQYLVFRGTRSRLRHNPMVSVNCWQSSDGELRTPLNVTHALIGDSLRRVAVSTRIQYYPSRIFTMTVRFQHFAHLTTCSHRTGSLINMAVQAASSNDLIFPVIYPVFCPQKAAPTSNIHRIMVGSSRSLPVFAGGRLAALLCRAKSGVKESLMLPDVMMGKTLL